MVRAAVALITLNARYWPRIAPLVRAQLRHWKCRARAIPDPVLQALALKKLSEEGFNAEVAATLASLAPRAQRRDTVTAIVALEVLYDYLDGLTEQPVPDPVRAGRCVFRAFIDAVTPGSAPPRDYYAEHAHATDGRYLNELVITVKIAMSKLPARAAVAEITQRGATRCVEAQIRINTHASAAQLEQWATGQAAGTGLQWRESLAGAAASVLAIHALIAAAADPRTTREQAAAIDTVYLSICALTTLLDTIVDYEHDLSSGEPRYISHYEDHDILAAQLAGVAIDAASKARRLPHGAHHVMTLVGVVAYYSSAPTANSDIARPIIAHLHRQLTPLIAPTLLMLRTWRRVKGLHAWSRRLLPGPAAEQPSNP
jgi:tetraprenyl-beta-curcumene synthase